MFKLFDQKLNVYIDPCMSKDCQKWVYRKLYKFIKLASPQNIPSQNVSLGLISNISMHHKIYNELKQKYCLILKSKWPLSTDPKKHVFEEMSIAAYLMTYWNSCNFGTQHKFKFLDLGCGNGLLTLFLTSSGYTGKGIDVRKRKTWPLLKTLEEKIDLEEVALDPSNESILFPDYEWLIGNHSDELTPWIPKLSARNDDHNMPRNKIFIIPCCPFDFYGKYQRKRPGMSHYEDYLQYISTDLCETSYNFQVFTDKLRIPSTKRTCIIGLPQKMSADDDFKTQTNSPNTDRQNTSNPLKFFPRPKVEPVRNCTKMDKIIVKGIIKKAFEAILAKDLFSTLKIEDTVQPHLANNKLWHTGGTLTMAEIMQLLDDIEIKALKNQDGGFRTLLKNNKNVFKVIGKNVTLQTPFFNIIYNSGYTSEYTTKKQGHIKSKLCYFYQFHPDGCPFFAINCSYAHGDDDILKYPK